MKKLLFTLILVLSVLAMQARHVVDVTRCGAVGDGRTLCTEVLDSLIRVVPDGSVVRFPRGTYLTGTLHLRSHITLELAEGATLLASTNLRHYAHYQPSRDMSRYDSGRGTRNANLTSDTCWTRALLLGQNLTDVRICGRGTIDGRHLPDSLGEEGMRGPHALLLAECSNVRVEGIHIRRAANYAILGYELSHATFRHLHITEGWDGIHIRGGEHLRIEKCHIRTGDDCIAGGYWQDMRIRHCTLNSSCNGIRMMEPSQGVEIDHISVEGPGEFPHLTSGAARRTGTIYGIVLEPGAWGPAPGESSGIRLHHLRLHNMFGPIAYSMGPDNPCRDIRISHLRSCCRLTIPFNNQGSERMWEDVRMWNIRCEKYND